MVFAVGLSLDGYAHGELVRLLKKRVNSKLTYLERCKVLHWLDANIRGGADVDEKDEDMHQSALGLAVKGGHWFIVEKLLKLNADVNATNVLGENPLMLACAKLRRPKMKNKEMLRRRKIAIRLLQECDEFNYNITDLSGKSALTNACACGDLPTVEVGTFI